MKSINHNKGFTLVELMIALVLSSILAMAIFQLLKNYSKSANLQDQVIQMQQNARVAISDLERDIRMAGVGTDSSNSQPVFVYAGPFGVTFNSDVDSTISAMRISPATAPDQVPANPAAGIVPYIPTNNYGTAETIRWTLDSNDDGVINSSDKSSALDPTNTTNPSIYQLRREVYGYNAATNKNGASSGQPLIAVAAEQVRGPDAYPDGTRPVPLFQYWIKEDRDGDGIIDNGEINVNGSTSGGQPTADEYLWGDDGSNGGTANNGILEPGEISAIIQNNKILDTSGTVITSSNGDSRVAGSTRAVQLANVSRVMITLISETTQPDKNYTTSTHGSSYQYRETVVGSTIDPRNPNNSALAASASLVLSASPLSVACPTTQSTITAQALNSSGSPVAGVVVNFSTTSASFNSGSTVLTASGTTDSGGLATATLYNPGGGPQSATVSASGTISGAAKTGIVTVGFVSGGPTNIAAAGSPPSLPADGTSVSTINAVATDACGNRVADGTTVSFALATVPVGIGAAVNPIAGQTLSGNVSTVLTSATSSGIGTITATVGSANGAAMVNFSGCTLSLVPQSTGIPGDGTSHTNITATLKDLSNNPISGILINFATTDGSLGPSSSKTTSGTTDGNGQVISPPVTITSSPFPHSATITGIVPADAVTCSNAIGSTIVNFTSCNATAVASPAAIAKSSTTAITATFTDSSTGSPLSGETITFSKDNNLGTFSGTSATTNGSGQATVNFTSGNTPGSTKITASSVCGLASVSVPIKSCVVVVSANPKIISPNGSSTSAITATLTDSLTNNPMAGESVTFSTDRGSITGSPTATTDSTGAANATLQSSSTPGTATVTATSLCGSSTTAVDFNQWGMTLTPSPANINWNGGVSTLTATITKDGVVTQPPAGSVVTFSFVSPPGSLSSSLGTNPATPSAGVATTTLTSGLATGTVTVQASLTISGVATTAQTNVTIAAVGGQLTLDAVGTTANCSSSHELVNFRIKNTDLTYAVTLRHMTVTWNKTSTFGPGFTTYLGEVKSEGTLNLSNCNGGSDLWKFNGCGGSGSRLASVASFNISLLDAPAACKTSTIPANSTYVFNDLIFNTATSGGGNKPDMRVPISITFTYTLGSDSTLLTSTINFTPP